MAKRNANGDGTIYKRKDGRWEACSYQKTVSGRIKRFRVVSADRETARAKLVERLAEAKKGILLSDETWTVGGYLDYWMNEVIAHKNRPRTIELYESLIRLHLKPSLGSTPLADLSARQLQAAINEMSSDGKTVRTIQQARQVLRAALNRAMREEIIHRNVATMVDVPRLEREPITVWNPQQVQEFLTAAEDHRWHGAYLLLCIYGMRRGEVLGLRWQDIDFEAGYIHVRQQLQRVGGVLTEGPVKTSAGRRNLPLTPLVRATLEQHAYSAAIDPRSPHSAHSQSQAQELVFLSSTFTPIDPHNFTKTFQQIRAQAGLPRIKLHHLRHGAATLLKNLGVPARDVQLILGHANVTTTQQIYQHADTEGQKIALEEVGRSLVIGDGSTTSRQNYPSKINSVGENLRFTPGGPAGTRTPDTLLKSLMFLISVESSTPVISVLRARISTQLLGAVAVKTTRQNLSALTPFMEGRWSQLSTLRHGLRSAVNLLRNPWPEPPSHRPQIEELS